MNRQVLLQIELRSVLSRAEEFSKSGLREDSFHLSVEADLYNVFKKELIQALSWRFVVSKISEGRYRGSSLLVVEIAHPDKFYVVLELYGGKVSVLLSRDVSYLYEVCPLLAH